MQGCRAIIVTSARIVTMVTMVTEITMVTIVSFISCSVKLWLVSIIYWLQSFGRL